jgi:hypothetical protein
MSTHSRLGELQMAIATGDWGVEAVGDVHTECAVRLRQDDMRVAESQGAGNWKCSKNLSD